MNRVRHIMNHMEEPVTVSDDDHTIVHNNQCASSTTEEDGPPKEYGGQLAAHALLEQGITHIFTLTGGHISPILVACNQSGIKVIDVRDEVTTVFAADAHARITGVPGVAVVTAGPGLTNTITAVKNAQMAESPVIVMGGATSMLLKGRGSLQDIDQMALMSPHVKWTASIKTVASIIPTIRRAFVIAKSGIPGPVFIEYPLETIWPRTSFAAGLDDQFDDGDGGGGGGGFSFTSFNPMKHLAKWYLKYHIHKVFKDGFTAHLKDEHSSAHTNTNGINNNNSMHGQHLALGNRLNRKLTYTTFNEQQLNQCVLRVVNSQRPLLVLGSQAVLHPSLIPALVASVERLNLPVYLSGMARGLLGESHPLYFRHKRSATMKKCDLLLLCGVSMDFRLNYGRSIHARAFFVHINLDAHKLKVNRDIRKRQLSFNGDPQTFILRLSEIIQRHGIDPAKETTLKTNRDLWFADIQSRENKREKQIDAIVDENDRSDPNMRFIHPLRFLRTLNRHINDDSYLIADGGDFVGTASYTVKPRRPLRWLDPGAFGTLGCGAGFALGVAAVNSRPEVDNSDQEIWVLYGDGSFGWSIMEFDTFSRHKYPVIAVIGNDACWSQMWRDQVRILKDPVAAVLEYSDYHTCVEGFGCKGILLDRECDMVEKILLAKKYAKQGYTVVLNVLLTKSKFREGSISL